MDEREMYERYQPDMETYHRRVWNEPRLVCAIVSRDPGFPVHHVVVHEDEAAISFLNRRQTQYGYTLVAPKEPREQATDDFTPDEYLGLQRVVHRVAEAVRAEVGAERLYILSLGSNQGNSHVHRHVVPLPPGTPYEDQQFAAVTLEIPEEEKASLAARIGRRIERW